MSTIDTRLAHHKIQLLGMIPVFVQGAWLMDPAV